MRFVGFIEEHDKLHPNSISLLLLRKGRNYDKDFKQKIINYLESGVPIWFWMEYWFDSDNLPIDGATYLYDGKWAWPLYFPYYLKKYEDIYIDEEFLSHCKSVNFKMIAPNLIDIQRVERQFGIKSGFIDRESGQR